MEGARPELSSCLRGDHSWDAGDERSLKTQQRASSPCGLAQSSAQHSSPLLVWWCSAPQDHSVAARGMATSPLTSTWNQQRAVRDAPSSPLPPLRRKKPPRVPRGPLSSRPPPAARASGGLSAAPGAREAGRRRCDHPAASPSPAGHPKLCPGRGEQPELLVKPGHFQHEPQEHGEEQTRGEPRERRAQRSRRRAPAQLPEPRRHGAGQEAGRLPGSWLQSPGVFGHATGTLCPPGHRWQHRGEGDRGGSKPAVWWRGLERGYFFFITL